ncbi:zinc finger protein OZF-like, partial [Plectropomus leopardus]|uniref:zinc finger protein OZF-like n=1 Tax=Plectropomus leopardus TaxID=160734 RepID=UPI001C4B3C83
LCPADIQQLLVVEEELLPSSVDQEDPEPPHIKEEQEDPEPPHIKEEQEELWSSQEGEQLQGLEEADITKFPFTPVPVKSEDDEEKPQSSQLRQRLTEQMETEADGEDCGGPGPDRNSHPDTHLQPETEDKTGDSSEPEIEVSVDDCKETREPQSGLNSLKNNQVPVSEKPFSCSECGKRYGVKKNLKRHMITHSGETPFSCSECGKRFGFNKAFNECGNLRRHMITHTGKKPFSCSVCGKGFSENAKLKIHIRTHTGEKPFSCTMCDKAFNEQWSLTSHMRSHTGEKPFRCTECGKAFSTSGTLHSHRRTHTGEKPYSCSVCHKSYTQSGSLSKHMKSHK